ncbi:hypothetical protein LEMLEM_LOCUS50 [Lemmus lemmus]
MGTPFPRVQRDFRRLRRSRSVAAYGGDPARDAGGGDPCRRRRDPPCPGSRGYSLPWDDGSLVLAFRGCSGNGCGILAAAVSGSVQRRRAGAVWTRTALGIGTSRSGALPAAQFLRAALSLRENGVAARGALSGP